MAHPLKPTILILSRGRNEPTTEAVMDWLEKLGANFFRLNAEDLEYPGVFEFRLPAGDRPFEFQFIDRFTGEDRLLDLSQVKAVWYRRWTLLRQYNFHHIESFTDDHRLQGEVTRYLHREIEAISPVIFEALRHARWLSEPATARLNKLRALHLAAELGIDIPATRVVTSKTQLLTFFRERGALITKNSGRSPLSLDLEEGDIASYTSALDEEMIERLPDHFFPSLVQERVLKAYEVRAFFLESQFYAMAMFTQRDPRTQMDFRRYPADRPNRYVPYRLPQEVEHRLSALAEALDLTTGSIDLIRATDGRYVFLEINPVGQFGMVSGPCNYNLEKRMAEALMRYARA